MNTLFMGNSNGTCPIYKGARMWKGIFLKANEIGEFHEPKWCRFSGLAIPAYSFFGFSAYSGC
jgi:hypothetical protein